MSLSNVTVRIRTRMRRGASVFFEPTPIAQWADRRIAELEHDELEAQIEQRIRNRIADDLRALRHARRPDQPDTWFWGITTAERTARGDHR